MKAVAESMEPILSSVQTPTQAHNRSHSESDEHAALTRKHGVLVEEWAGVQREADLLREELREDKWLTVFRTVTDQADGMMNSLDKAVNRCQVRYSLSYAFYLRR
jgi:ribosomal protein S4